MKVLLTGFMGSGKTTVGRRLAERLDLPFYDLDQMIEEQAGRCVREIFETDGEEEFRRLERSALEAVLELPRAVVATGGGTLVDRENLERSRGCAVSVWLDAPIEVIESRLDESQRHARPLLREPAAARDLLRDRVPAYSEANVRLAVEAGESVDQIVERLLVLLEETSCATS